MMFWVSACLPLVLYGLGSGSYDWPKWSAMGFCAGVGVVQMAWNRRAIELDMIDGLSAALLLWAALSVSWTPDTAYGILCASRGALMWVVFAIARRSEPEIWVPRVCAVAILSAAANQFFGGGSFGGLGNANTAAEVVLIALPFLIGGPRLWAWPVAALSLLFVEGGERSHLPMMTALAAAFAVFAYWRPKAAIGALLIGCMFAAIALDAHPEWYTQYAAMHINPRLQMWLATAAMTWDHPIALLFGRGLSGFEFFYPDYQAWPLQVFPSLETWLMSSILVRAGSSHQEFLQLWSELGMIGITLFVTLIAVAFRQSVSWSARWAVGIALFLSALDFPLQKPAPGLLAVVALATLATANRVAISSVIRGPTKGRAPCAPQHSSSPLFSRPPKRKRSIRQVLAPLAAALRRDYSRAKPSN